MIWLNIEVSTLHSLEFIGSEPVNRATWLCLFGYCCAQENGGVIKDCRQWKSRLWEQTCGVTQDEVHSESMLWTWEGNDLRVWKYPSAREAEIRAKRAGGYAGGKASGRARRKASREASNEAELQAPGEAELQAELQPSREAMPEALLERKGREGKGMEEYTREDMRVRVENEKWLALAQTPPSCAEEQEPHIPSEDEVVEFGKGVAALPESYCRHYHAKKTECQSWVTPHGRLVLWKREIVRWWSTDRATWGSRIASGTSGGIQTPSDGSNAATEPARQQSQPVWAQVRSVKEALTIIGEKLQAITLPPECIDPDGYKAALAKRAPLLQQRRELKAKLDQLQMQQASEV